MAVIAHVLRHLGDPFVFADDDGEGISKATRDRRCGLAGRDHDGPARHFASLPEPNVVVPANDDAVSSVALILQKVEKAVLKAQKAKKKK